MRKDWRDPRDGTIWVIRIWEPTTLQASGHAVPRVISFRRQAAYEVYSTGLDGKKPEDGFSDVELQDLLDRARLRVAS